MKSKPNTKSRGIVLNHSILERQIAFLDEFARSLDNSISQMNEDQEIQAAQSNKYNLERIRTSLLIFQRHLEEDHGGKLVSVLSIPQDEAPDSPPPSFIDPAPQKDDDPDKRPAPNLGAEAIWDSVAFMRRLADSRGFRAVEAMRTAADQLWYSHLELQAEKRRASMLVVALKKFAPDLMEELVHRWSAYTKAADDFIALLRKGS